MHGKEIVHNILTKGVQEEEAFEYTNAEARVLATFIQYAHVHFQLPRALRKFGEEGKTQQNWRLNSCMMELVLKHLLLLNYQNRKGNSHFWAKKAKANWCAFVQALPPDHGR